jgi:hypothetical protein
MNNYLTKEKNGSSLTTREEIDILVFKTNIRYKKDMVKIAPIFNGHPDIIRWNIDMTDIDKVARIESVNLAPADIIQAIHKAGYYCEELPD